MSFRRVFVLAAVLAAALLLPASASALKFSPPGNPISGLGAASGIATGDFNEDGDADIVFAVGTDPGGLLLQFSDGDGTFTAGTPLASGSPGFYAVWTGDFNGDSHVDVLALPYSSSTLGTYLGNGEGEFSFAGGTLLVANGLGERNSLAVGDLNEDGADDFIAGSFGNNVTVAISNGSGGFSTSLVAPGGGHFRAATIADISGDGNLDAAVADGGAIYTLIGDGSGGMTPVSGSAVLSAPVGEIQSLASADFDEDGRADIAATSIVSGEANGSVQTFLGQSNAGLITNPNVDGRLLSGMNPSDVVSGDFNLDGNADLAYLARDSTCGCAGPVRGASVALGDGEGEFTEAGGSPYQGNIDFANVFGLETGDMNDDGALDLAIGIFGGANTGMTLFNAPDLTSDIDSISFNEHKVGSSTLVNRELINQGGPEITIEDISIDGPDSDQFAISPSSLDCEAVLPPAESCQVGVTFSPASTGVKTAQMVVTYAESETPLVLGLFGEGVTSAASVDPESLDFGETRINTADTRTVTVTSSGTADLLIDQLSLSGANASRFSLSDDECSDTDLAPTETCTVEVTASPTAIGELAATLEIPNDGTAASTVPITAEGINPEISVSPASYEFNGAEVGGVGQGNQFTVTSTGTTPLNVSNIEIGGDDAADFDLGGDDCEGNSIPAGETCSFVGIFHPEAGPVDAREASFIVESNTSDATVEVTGTATYGDTKISPDPVEFGDMKVGQASETRSVTLTAGGTASMYTDDVELAGDDPEQFEITDDTDCTEQETPAGESCEIEVRFNPSSTGTKNAVLFVDTITQEVTTNLTGTGIDPAGTLTPASQDFGSVAIGQSGAAKSFGIASTGGSPLDVTSATIGGADAGSFKLTDAAVCNGPKTPGSTCDLSVSFAPESGSSSGRSATLTVVTNAGSLTSTLTGTAVATTVPGTAKITLKSAKKVKRGKTLVVTANVRHMSGGAISGILLAATVAAKFGKAPKAIKLPTLSPGKTISRKIKIRVKKSAKPGKKLAVTVKAIKGGKTLAKSKRVATIKK